MYILIFLVRYCAPKNSFCISSLGSEEFSRVFHLDSGSTGFRFLAISVQGLQLAALLGFLGAIRARMHIGQKKSSQASGCVRWRDSNTVAWIHSGIATRSPLHAHPDCTCKLRQYECMYGLTSLHHCP